MKIIALICSNNVTSTTTELVAMTWHPRECCVQHKVSLKYEKCKIFATINELTVLSNLESHNAQMIKEGKKKEERFKILQEIAEYQLNVLNTAEKIKMLEDENQLVEI